eukprot:CAMPEP_0180662476 /NCGR_PEP_ID=MMETSP1037_2-20121125/59417_1 /TAXON_ID=632150 /ORGANISM="Azadinium spinosum, Strain 3D9" /LENGTH=124 /DNA_ID=CAMNT_0022690151 /DNA_START=21 /DNA_END=392 /DNA_ORIENTATION=+
MSWRFTTRSLSPKEMFPLCWPRLASAFISVFTASGKARQTPGEPQPRSRNSHRGGKANSKAASQSAFHWPSSSEGPLACMLPLTLNLYTRGRQRPSPHLVKRLPVLPTEIRPPACRLCAAPAAT